jgi:hypothetical protein
MTLEMCEIQLVETLTALDALGAGSSRSACYIAMAIDSIGEAGDDIDDKVVSLHAFAKNRSLPA